MESVVPLSATSLTAESISGRAALADPAPTAAAPDTDCASELSLAGGAARAAPCAASVGGPQGVGAHSASPLGAVRNRPGREELISAPAIVLEAATEPIVRRRVSTTGVSAGRSLRSFATALLFVTLTTLFACATALLIAEAFYGYGGLR